MADKLFQNYFSQIANPEYRQAQQQQNLFSNLLQYGAQMRAAGAPTTNVGQPALLASQALGTLGQNMNKGNQAYQNQLMNAIKLKSLMRQNELAQAEAKRKTELFPLRKKKLEKDSAPPPMFGSGQRGKALEIWTLAQRNPKLKSDPSYTAAVGVLSTTTRVPTPQGVIEYPPMMSPDGIMYGTGKPVGTGKPDTVTSTIPRPQPKIISQTAEQKLDLSPAQKQIDLDFGKQYSKQIVGGLQADFDANVEKLESVLSKLQTSDSFTGPYIGSIPQNIKEITHPKAADAQELVEGVVQRQLRIILGAQFTEKEGERLIKRAYNPRLDEAENIKRLTRLINSMKKARKAQLAASKYFQENNGTLKGYDGTKIFTLDSIARDSGLEFGEPPSSVSRDQWEAMTADERKAFSKGK